MSETENDETESDEIEIWDDLIGIKEDLLRGIYNYGFEKPSPIQKKAIIPIFKKTDIVAQAQSGTGKTGCFVIGVLQLIDVSLNETQCIILAPTRELAVQIGDALKVYGRDIPLRHTVVFGGVGQNAQVTAMRRGVDILVATPGRLLDLFNQKHIRLDYS